MSDKHHDNRNFWGMMGMLWWLAAIEEEERFEQEEKDREERQRRGDQLTGEAEDENEYDR